MRISEIIHSLKQWHIPLDDPGKTRDTVKIGDTDRECTGIIVTCYASIDVIRKARCLNCNLIICHEPLFYDNKDDTLWLREDRTYNCKRSLLEEGGIVVWRDHDHMHGPGGPRAERHEEIDYVYYGIMKELGWEQYVVGEKTKPMLYEIPPIPAEELTRELLEKFNLKGARIVGDKKAPVSKIYFCENVFGGVEDRRTVLKAADFDAMIPTEIVEWSLTEYIRDAAQAGYGKVIIELGHFNTAELGMRYMSKWLPEVLESDIPVIYIQSGDSFDYILR